MPGTWRQIIDVPAGECWPECAEGTAPALPAFGWIRVENRNAAAGDDLVVSWSQAQVPAADAHTYDMKVKAGNSRYQGISVKDGDALPRELRITNLSGANAVTALVIISTSPLTDYQTTV